MAKDSEHLRSLSWEADNAAPSGGGVNHLLVIGIDAYVHHRRLNNARRDAQAFRDLLTARYQFDPARVTELYDEAATRRRIIETLESLEHRLKPTDNLLIYFSGHGTMNAKKSQGFWVPVDAEKSTADYLPNDQVRAMIRDMEAHHIYLIVDACFSGSMILRSSSAAHELLEQNPSRRVLTSGRQEAVSDGPPGGHSPFFDCIRHQLSLGQPLSAIELENYVIHNTPRTANQLPEADFILGVGDQSGKFVFRPKRDEARDWADAQAEHTPAAYRRYLDAYPQGVHAEEAVWQLACVQPQDKQGYRAYLAQFPRGVHALAAIERIDFLDRELRYQEALRRGEAGLHRFLQDYPDGPFADDARAELGRILAAEQEAKQRENEVRRAQVAHRQAEAQHLEQERQAAEQAEAARKRQEAEAARRAEEERQAREAQQPGPIKVDAPIFWRRPLVQVAGIGLPLLLLLVWGISSWTGASDSDPAEQSESQAVVSLLPSLPDTPNPTTQNPKPPNMVRIPGGSFEMGDVLGDNEFISEKPVHWVTVSDFWIGKYEVTFEQYDAYCEATGTKKPEDQGWGRSDRPVINISWYDAVAYCNWLSGQAGYRAVYQIDGDRVTADWSANGYRLPTEAEWEYAAREGGKKVRFGNGKDIADPAQMNFDGSAAYKESYSVVGEYRRRTVPGGSFAPNALGLYDMSGNVWEWCWDWFGDYSRGAQTDPRGPQQDSYRVFRGGGWSSSAELCRATTRDRTTPHTVGLGFRLARSF